MRYPIQLHLLNRFYVYSLVAVSLMIYLGYITYFSDARYDYTYDRHGAKFFGSLFMVAGFSLLCRTVYRFYTHAPTLIIYQSGLQYYKNLQYKKVLWKDIRAVELEAQEQEDSDVVFISLDFISNYFIIN